MLLPYRHLMNASSAIVASPWIAGGVVVGDAIDWHPGLDVELECTLSVDRVAAAAALGYDAVGSCVVVVDWTSDTTRLRESCGRYELLESTSVSVRLPGDRIGGRVRLRRRLVTKCDLPPSVDFVPTVVGSVLWEETVEFRVEGSGPQFPVLVTAFEGAGLASNAAWAVGVVAPAEMDDPGDFHEPAAEHVSVRLNSNHPIVDRLVNEPSSDLARLAIGQISCDLARGVLELAQLLPVPPPEYADGSLGALILATLHHLGMESSLDIARPDSEELAAIIQDRYLGWGSIP